TAHAGTVEPSKSHMHFAELDPYTNPASPRIWIGYHRTVAAAGGYPVLRRVRYSDDKGVTWVDVSTTLHPVTATPTPYGVVFGTDNDLNGLLIARDRTAPALEPFLRLRRGVVDGYWGFATKAVTQGDTTY